MNTSIANGRLPIADCEALERLAELARQVREEVDRELEGAEPGLDYGVLSYSEPTVEPWRKERDRHPQLRSGWVASVKRKRRAITCRYKAKRGEMLFKTFVGAECRRNGLSPGGVLTRWYAGKYPDVGVRRVNQRVVFVRVYSLPPRECRILKKGPTPHSVIVTEPGEVSLKEWVRGEMARTGMSQSGVYMRYYRGQYPQLVVSRRINARTVFVRLNSKG